MDSGPRRSQKHLLGLEESDVSHAASASAFVSAVVVSGCCPGCVLEGDCGESKTSSSESTSMLTSHCFKGRLKANAYIFSLTESVAPVAVGARSPDQDLGTAFIALGLIEDASSGRSNTTKLLHPEAAVSTSSSAGILSDDAQE